MENQSLLYAIITFVLVIALTVLGVMYYFKQDMIRFYIFIGVAAVFFVLAARSAYKYFSDKRGGGKK